jgi:uncharacterized protein YmfQ (DUF2313 family)
MTAFGRDAYLAQLAALLPTGPALPREADSVLMRLLGMPAAELAAVQARVDALLAEADPRITAELLPDWEAAFGLPDDCSPLSTFRRASLATWLDAGGQLRTAQVDEPRPVLDPVTGLPTGATMVEPGATNAVANPRAEGGSPGTPGTPPTGWSLTNTANGITRQILGATTEDGIPCFDVRYSTAGPSGATALVLGFSGSGVAAPACTPSAPVTGSAFVRVIAGSLAGLDLRERLVTFTAGGASTSTQPANATIAPSAAPLRVQRFAVTRTLPADAAFCQFRLDAGYSLGVPFDVTLRIGAPQREDGEVATSVILPPIGTPGASTRAADLLVTASDADRRASLLARILGVAGQSRAYFVALAATLGYAGATVEEFRQPRAGVLRAGDAVHGFEWSQTWRLRLGASAVRPARAGSLRAGDPLTTFGDARLECAVRRVAPAHTLPLFAYGA